MESRRAYAQRRKTIALGMLLALGLAAALAVLLAGCGGGAGVSTASTPSSPAAATVLSATDVQNIVQRAAQASDEASMVIAVVDRGGSVLAVYRKPGAARRARPGILELRST